MTLRFAATGADRASGSAHNRSPSNGSIEEKAVKTHMLCALAVGLAGFATTASAQIADSETIHINTKVSPYCQTAFAIAPAPLALGELADPIGRTVATFAGTTTANLGNYMCNTPAKVTLTASPLMSQDVAVVDDASSFTNRVDYQAQLTWGAESLSTASDAGSPAEHNTTQANTGQVNITVSNPVAPLRPVAGDYQGAVTLNIAAL